jgi:hypothetical protein
MKEYKIMSENRQEAHNAHDSTTSLRSNVHPVMLNAIFSSLMRMEKEQVNLPQSNIMEENEFDGEVEH